MKAFKKTMKSAPVNARSFANGDISVKRDGYVKGEPMFAYYKKTAKGYSLEKYCYTGREAGSYNWQKVNNPNFVPHSQWKKQFVKKKQAVKAKPKAKAKVNKIEQDFINTLNKDLENEPHRFELGGDVKPKAKLKRIK
jgi:hypothetical protein